MNWGKWLWLAVLALAVPSAAYADTYVLGDSIGDGLATTLGLKNLAQIGIHIRGPKALAQIARTPPGSTVYIFLGTNDAEDNLKNIDKSIADVVDAAARRQLKVIWVGPHCVRKRWDDNDRKLDEILRAQLAATAVYYVSTREPGLCSGKFLEPDGVHLVGKGYRYLWAMVQNAVAVPLTGAAMAASAPQKAAADGNGVATTGSIGVKHRLVMEIHVPGALSEPLVWTRAEN